jgi:hypothetical protein
MMQKRVLASAKRMLKILLHRLCWCKRGCQNYFCISWTDAKIIFASAKRMTKTNTCTCISQTDANICRCECICWCQSYKADANDYLMRCQSRRLFSIGWPMQQIYSISKPDANHFYRPMRKTLFPIVLYISPHRVFCSYHVSN